MENTTSFTFLYVKGAEDTGFAKAIDINSYPDTFTPPEKIDVSNLSSNQRKYAPGMTDLPDYEFGFVWDFEAYKQIKEKYVGKKDTQWQLRFGENGEYGAWEWTGDCFIAPVGGSTGAARTGRIVCYPETDVVDAEIA